MAEYVLLILILSLNFSKMVLTSNLKFLYENFLPGRFPDNFPTVKTLTEREKRDPLSSPHPYQDASCRSGTDLQWPPHYDTDIVCVRNKSHSMPVRQPVSARSSPGRKWPAARMRTEPLSLSLSLSLSWFPAHAISTRHPVAINKFS